MHFKDCQKNTSSIQKYEVLAFQLYQYTEQKHKLKKINLKVRILNQLMNMGALKILFHRFIIIECSRNFARMY